MHLCFVSDGVSNGGTEQRGQRRQHHFLCESSSDPTVFAHKPGFPRSICCALAVQVDCFVGDTTTTPPFYIKSLLFLFLVRERPLLRIRCVEPFITQLLCVMLCVTAAGSGGAGAVGLLLALRRAQTPLPLRLGTHERQSP